MKKFATVVLLLALLCTLPACSGYSNQTAEMSDLRGEYFDFAQKYHLNYIPYFEDNSATTDGSEYLMWAFAVNLDNWGEDKDTMSAAYIEEIVQKHFNVTDLAHNSLPKCWDYADGVYTAVPSGINPLPIVILRSYEENEADGQTIYQINVDFCNSKTYGASPNNEQYQEIRQAIVKGDYDDLEIYQSDSFTFYLENDEPVFTSHQNISQ